MFDSGARQPAGGEGGDGAPVSVVPPGPKLALNGPGPISHSWLKSGPFLRHGVVLFIVSNCIVCVERNCVGLYVSMPQSLSRPVSRYASHSIN